ncbi:MAG: molybdopterin molybdotransferase MoeA [Planctomycetes bacterium]|nr:molybdopterin molybdotransferase MoeA [Planctomycetota bacterium]
MKLTHPHDALKMTLSLARPLTATRVSLDRAAGLCLALPVRADRDQPPTDRSAVDGYALRAADTRDSSQMLRLEGESAAGKPCENRVAPGTCIRILTGAVVPGGADAVIMLEHTQMRDGKVRCLREVAPAANIRRRGEEAAKGAVILPPGALLSGAQIGICASVGKALVTVRPRPRVAVLSTGSELKEAADRVRAHQTRDANGPALCAVLELAGFPAARRGIVGDDVRQLRETIRSAARDCDVILLSGGVSVGSYDFVPEAIRSLRGRIRFHGVSMKPGKPVLYATLGRKHIFGLPGNPIGALVMLHLFVKPALRRLAGWPPQWCRPVLHVALEEAFKIKGPRVEYRLACLSMTKGGPRARLLKSAGSADLPAACQADGVVELDPRSGDWVRRDSVPFISWRPIW